MLAATSRDLVLEHCLREGGILPLVAIARIHLYAVVIMPDHVHFLLRPLRDPNGWPYPLVDILQCLKGATAHRINKLLSRAGPVWEEESLDHVLRSDESLKDKVEYIRQNPVRRGYGRARNSRRCGAGALARDCWDRESNLSGKILLLAHSIGTVAFGGRRRPPHTNALKGKGYQHFCW
jgi:REP element-mobilizing transposase RayT